MQYNIENSISEAINRSSPDISIIVPVYQAEDTLARCINSVLKQDMDNFELILIDDGSTDGSAGICDCCRTQDKRIRVVHKENTGVSDSRNLGIRMAKGKYIQFLDSDDWLVPEACRLLFCAAERSHCDLVISDFYRVIDDRIARKGAIKKEGIIDRDSFSAYLMERPSDFYYGVLWNKLFRRDIIERHKIYLNEEVSWCEDIIFNLEYFAHMETVYVLRVPLYYYVKNSNSLSNNGITLSRVIQTKMLVSEYYKEFCTQTAPKGKADKVSMYRFYLRGATDGRITSHASRLGEERVRLNLDLVTCNGLFSEQYLEQKLFKYCLKNVAYQSDLTEEELSVLLCIDQHPKLRSRKEIRELTRISKRKVKMILQKLRMIGYIDWTEDTGAQSAKERRDFGEIQIMSAAKPILDQLESVKQRQEEIRFSGFSEQEKVQYEAYTMRIQQNMIQALTGEYR